MSVVSELLDGVYWITLDRPDQMNAIDSKMRSLIIDAFEEAERNHGARVVVLTGNGGSFSAGVDLKEAAPDERHPLARDQDALVAPVQRCRKPVVAAIDGPAVGGGFELALAADIRLATPRAFFALTELRMGSLPGSGGTQRLFSAVPSAIAWRLILSGERMNARRAYEVGLVSDLIDVDGFRESVQVIARRIASAAPLSLQAAKLAGKAGMEHAGEVGLALERALWAALATTDDRMEGRTAFREKREPDFEGK